jgi:hypothetical protein
VVCCALLREQQARVRPAPRCAEYEHLAIARARRCGHVASLLLLLLLRCGLPLLLRCCAAVLQPLPLLVVLLLCCFSASTDRKRNE